MKSTFTTAQLRELEGPAKHGPIVSRADLEAELRDLAPLCRTIAALHKRGVPARKVADFFVCSPEAIRELWK